MNIPIFIGLQYEHNMMKFPINPEKLKVDIDSSSSSADVEGIGEVSIPSKPKLAKLNISSMFWHETNLLPSFLYVNWIKKWQKSEKPAKLIVTKFNYSMLVTCENFSHEVKAGEEEDVYFDLSLKEYRPYGARRLNVADQNNSLMSKIKEMLSLADSATLPVLIEVPRPVRSRNMKESIGNTFKAVTGYTTLCAIAKKETGSSAKWKDLWEVNKDALANTVEDGCEIAVGTVLTIPDNWRK